MVLGWEAVSGSAGPIAGAVAVFVGALLLLWRLRHARATAGRQDLAVTQANIAGNAVGFQLQRFTDQQDALVACRDIMSRLSFRDSIDHEKFAAVVQKSAEQLIETRLGLLTNGGSVALNSVQALQHGEMILTFSAKGQALLNAGQVTIARDAAGRLLPQLKDASGHVREFGRIGSVGKVGKVANVAAVVVGAAHLIAGADISKRLKFMDTKIDALLAFRRIDQIARIENAFASAKELLVLSGTRDTSSELWRLRSELRELRSIWRREFEHNLSQIEDKKGWFDRQKAVDGRAQQKLSEGEIHVFWLEYSLRLDRMLASASGTWEAQELSLADELKEFDILLAKFEEKRAIIKDGELRASLEPVTFAITEVVTQYRRMLPIAFSTVALDAVPALPKPAAQPA